MAIQPVEGISASALEALADAGLAVARSTSLGEAVSAVVDAAARATGAEVVVARIPSRQEGELVACAVAALSPALAAELEGSRLAAGDLPLDEIDELPLLPEPVRRACERAGAHAVLVLPILAGGEVTGDLELLRSGEPFDAMERRLARIAAAQIAVALRTYAQGAVGKDAPALELAGEALAAASDDTRTAEQVTRLAADAAGATACLLWRGSRAGVTGLVARHGFAEAAQPPTGDVVLELATSALAAPRAVTVARDDRLPRAAPISVTLQLGQPPIGALQLLFAEGSEPADRALGELATFGVRAAHALRASARTRTVAAELERTRALLGVVAQAIAQLSLAHTLETAVERVAELLDVEQLAIYLQEDGRLLAAAGRGLAGPHVRVASHLLELALGPYRGRGVLAVDNLGADPHFAPVAGAASEAGVEAAIAVPLLARDEVIGLLAVYPPRGRRSTENEAALLSALASQLAVAVQNAQLHEQAKQLGQELEHALGSERQAARQLRALYEISRSFAQSLSLEATLDAVTRTVVEVLDVDAAVIRTPDERRDVLVPRAMHVSGEHVAAAARTILFRPQPFGAAQIQRLFRDAQPFMVDGEGVDALLAPFLEKGWTGAVVPVAKAANDVLAALSLFSFRPGRPITQEIVDAAVVIAGQAALAIDNARLSQQQQEFMETMQRSLLPRSQPQIEGLEVGDVYESAASVEVGGDVYDFMTLEDGRLAVVLGDVTGHGIEAAADMAMAKFVFRSLAREHPEPSAFLSAANDVVVSEIASGKFITMVYLTIDVEKGEVACAGAGHPPPRLVAPDGKVTGLDAQGLVLGVDSGQYYETVRAGLEPGSTVVLYTDGVIEARRHGDLYGIERLDALLAARRDLSAKALALAIVADCRTYAGGELTDDAAVVVIKRSE